MKTFIRISFIFLVIAGIFFFNAGLIDLRLQEVQYLLGTVASVENVPKTLGIIAKYELIRNRMVYGEEDLSNYELEAKIQALTSFTAYGENQNLKKLSFYHVPVKLTVDAVRLLLGKKIINPVDNDNVFKILEIAYFWERHRKYDEAIKLYEQVLKRKDLTSDIRAAVLIHKAFCHSMRSEYETAKKTYEQVIADFPETEAGILSWKLLDFISSIEAERIKIQNTASSDFEKGKNYYMLMDYRNCIRYLSKFLEGRHRKTTVAEARFYKGRAHEELGETEEALLEYNIILKKKGTRHWARQANRRLIMLGEFYETKKQIALEARKRLKEYQDAMFSEKVDKFTPIIAENAEKRIALKKAVAGDTRDENLLAFINSIGVLDKNDLEFESEDVEDSIRDLSPDMVSSEKISKDSSENMKLLRRKRLARHPFRRPTALKKIIDKNANSLQYLYTKRVKNGLDVSGKLMVQIDIAADGTVHKARITQSNMGDSAFEKEVIENISGWRFQPVADSLGDLTVHYPFEFSSQ